MMTMMRHYLTLILLAIAMPCLAGKPKQLLILGDGWSDNGNHFQLTHKPSSPYWEGRFSNGPVWSEYLAQRFELIPDPELHPDYPRQQAFKSYAIHSSAIIKQHQLRNKHSSRLAMQVRHYLKHPFQKTQATWVVLFEGMNDLLNTRCKKQPFECTHQLIDAQSDLLHTLAQNELTEFIVFNLPHLSRLPLVANHQSNDERQRIDQLGKYYNRRLLITLSEFRKAHPHTKLTLIDTDQLLDAITPQFSLPANVPCMTKKVCDIDTQEDYLFWDDKHLSTKAHYLVAQHVAEKMAGK